MEISYNQSIKHLNTFNVDITANRLCYINSNDDFSNPQFIKCLTDKNIYILGKGSNTLFTKNFNGTIIILRNLGKKIVQKTPTHIEVQVNAGEDWDSFVKWSVKNNVVGLHNLAYIPGSVGATPIQNVGAYGVEIKDFLKEVEVFDIEKHTVKKISNSECKFGYRDSIFKNELKNKVIIKSVTFVLPIFNNDVDKKYTEYAGIFELINNRKITPKLMYTCIKKIRQSKLPEIKEYGSCGSTFKNPEITVSQYNNLLKIFPQLPKFETDKENIVKIPAAHILEKLGWKNKRDGDVGTWIYHPLIVTNYGNASGEEILQFINKMKSDFKSKTTLDLECEINII